MFQEPKDKFSSYRGWAPYGWDCTQPWPWKLKRQRDSITRFRCQTQKNTASEKIYSPPHLIITGARDMWESLSSIQPVYKLGLAQDTTASMGSSTAVSKCMINAWDPTALLAFIIRDGLCVKVKGETWLLSIGRIFNSRRMRHCAKRPCAQKQG